MILHLAPGFTSQECHVFFATGLTPGETQREKSEEDMEVAAFGPDEFRRMIVEGEITGCPTIAVWGIVMEKEILKGEILAFTRDPDAV